MKATKLKASIVGAFLLVGLASSSVTPSFAIDAPTLGGDGCPIEEPCIGYETEMLSIGLDTFATEVQATKDEARAWELYEKYGLRPNDPRNGVLIEFSGSAFGSDPEISLTQFRIQEPNNTNMWYIFSSVTLTAA